MRVRRFDMKPALTEQVRQWSAQLEASRALVNSASLGLIVGGERACENGWAQTPIGMAALFGLAEKPVFPLGIAGGAARQLASLLLNPEWTPIRGRPLPYKLERQIAIEESEKFNEGLYKLWTSYQKCLNGDHYFGLQAEILRRIVSVDSVRVIRRLLQRHIHDWQ